MIQYYFIHYICARARVHTYRYIYGSVYLISILAIGSHVFKYRLEFGRRGVQKQDLNIYYFNIWHIFPSKSYIQYLNLIRKMGWNCPSKYFTHKVRKLCQNFPTRPTPQPYKLCNQLLESICLQIVHLYAAQYPFIFQPSNNLN